MTPTKPLYVFDANAIISALLLSDSTPRRAFDKARMHGLILLSEPVINELDDVLRRPRLEKYIPKDKRIQFLVALLREARGLYRAGNRNRCRLPRSKRQQVS